MPHVPLFVSDKYKGKSGRGLYGDVIAELDWAVGRILDTVQAHRDRQRHAGGLHVGQRPVAVVWQPRRVG